MKMVIAIYHPKPEYADEFLAFMTRVEAVARGSCGMPRFGSWGEKEV